MPQERHLKKSRCRRSTDGGTIPDTAALLSVSSSPPHTEQRGSPRTRGTPLHALAMAETLAPSLFCGRSMARTPPEAARAASSLSAVRIMRPSRPASASTPESSPPL